MGISWIFESELYQELKMKFFATASAVIAAVSGQWLAAPYHGIVGLKNAPCVNAANVPVPCAAGYYGKRDADADPQLLVAGVPFGSSTGLDPITQGADPVPQGVALPYAGYAGYAAPYAAWGLGKREAEADPLVYAAAPAYAYAAPYAVAAPHAVAATYGGLVHSSLVGICTNVAGAQVPC